METLRGIGEAPRTIWKSSSIFLAGIAGDAVVRTRPRPRRGSARRLHQTEVKPAPVCARRRYGLVAAGVVRRLVGGRGRPPARWALTSLTSARRRLEPASLAWRGRSPRTEARRGQRLGLSRPHRSDRTVRMHPRGGRCFIYRPPWTSKARLHATSRRCAAASWPSPASMQPSQRAALLLCAGGAAAVDAAVWRALRGVRPDKPGERQRGAAHGSRRRLVPSRTGAAE